MKLFYRKVKFLFAFCTLGLLFFCARNTKKRIIGVYYSSCNEYQYAVDTLSIGLYPRPYFDFSAQEDSVTVFYSDASIRKTHYTFTHPDTIKIDQYGEWFFDQAANQLVWVNPFL